MDDDDVFEAILAALEESGIPISERIIRRELRGELGPHQRQQLGRLLRTLEGEGQIERSEGPRGRGWQLVRPRQVDPRLLRRLAGDPLRHLDELARVSRLDFGHESGAGVRLQRSLEGLARDGAAPVSLRLRALLSLAAGDVGTRVARELTEDSDRALSAAATLVLGRDGDLPALAGLSGLLERETLEGQQATELLCQALVAEPLVALADAEALVREAVPWPRARQIVRAMTRSAMQGCMLAQHAVDAIGCGFVLDIADELWEALTSGHAASRGWVPADLDLDTRLSLALCLMTPGASPAGLRDDLLSSALRLDRKLFCDRIRLLLSASTSARADCSSAIRALRACSADDLTSLRDPLVALTQHETPEVAYEAGSLLLLKGLLAGSCQRASESAILHALHGRAPLRPWQNGDLRRRALADLPALLELAEGTPFVEEIQGVLVLEVTRILEVEPRRLHDDDDLARALSEVCRVGDDAFREAIVARVRGRLASLGDSELGGPPGFPERHRLLRLLAHLDGDAAALGDDEDEETTAFMRFRVPSWRRRPPRGEHIDSLERQTRARRLLRRVHLAPPTLEAAAPEHEAARIALARHMVEAVDAVPMEVA